MLFCDFPNCLISYTLTVIIHLQNKEIQSIEITNFDIMINHYILSVVVVFFTYHLHIIENSLKLCAL